MNHESLDRIQSLQAAQAHQRKLTAPLASTRPTEQEREIRRLRTCADALEPFAAEYERREESLKALPLDAKPFSGLDITVGDLKAAYDACRRRG